MKKYIAAVLAVCSIAAALAGCGYKDALEQNSNATQSTTVSASADEAKEDKVRAEDFEDSFDGLEKYFIRKAYIVEKSSDKLDDNKLDDNKVTKMDASLIGAVNGKKYATKYNGNDVIVELYYYDLNKLNDTAKEIINSVKKDGTFRILPDDKGEYLPEVTAYLSDNGKYLMIYTDKKIDSANPDKTSDAYKHMMKVVEDFKAFH